MVARLAPRSAPDVAAGAALSRPPPVGPPTSGRRTSSYRREAEHGDAGDVGRPDADVMPMTPISLARAGPAWYVGFGVAARCAKHATGATRTSRATPRARGRPSTRDPYYPASAPKGAGSEGWARSVLAWTTVMCRLALGAPSRLGRRLGRRAAARAPQPPRRAAAARRRAAPPETLGGRHRRPHADVRPVRACRGSPSKLTPLQQRVLLEAGTERAFTGETVNGYKYNNEPGQHVSAISAGPLFSSSAKYDSGTGWPSFYAPVDKANVIERLDPMGALVSAACGRRSGASSSRAGYRALSAGRVY